MICEDGKEASSTGSRSSGGRCRPSDFRLAYVERNGNQFVGHFRYTIGEAPALIEIALNSL